MQILIIDDDKDSAELLKHQITHLNGDTPPEVKPYLYQLDVDCVTDPTKALCMTNQKHYDIVFVDVHMPGIDGVEVCKALRRIDKLTGTSVIAISASDVSNSTRDLLRAGIGVQEVSIKPVSSEQTAKFMKDAISAHEFYNTKITPWR